MPDKRQRYKIDGKRYKTLSSSKGYKKRGIASWYGSDFDGKQTACGEEYDMYDFTAAHKTLPLPSYVRVQNLRNGKTVIVKVNDRGPFVDDRLIDLSYAAAKKIDMIDKGTSPGKIYAVSGSGQSANSTMSVYVNSGGASSVNNHSNTTISGSGSWYAPGNYSYGPCYCGWSTVSWSFTRSGYSSQGGEWCKIGHQTTIPAFLYNTC